MEFAFLCDQPQFIPTIAKWYFDEWGNEVGMQDVAAMQERIESMLNKDRIPLHYIALSQGKPVRVIQLKFREMDIYPEKENWLGGVYVSYDARGKGIAGILIKEGIRLAKSLGVSQLYLQTEKLDGGLYLDLGWKPIEQVNYKGRDVVVMGREIS